MERDREIKIRAFWEKLECNLTSMIIVPNAEEIDRLERAEVLKYLPDFKDKDVLELGAGIGRYTTHFAASARRVVTNDIVSNFIRKNQEINAQFSNISYIVSDALKLEFPEKRFDFIFINWLMMYLDNDEVALLASRLASWLKPGGSLFFRESCSIPERHRTDHYYVHYRNFHFYTKLFSQYLQLIRHDNIKNSELHFADPFQCFWIFQDHEGATVSYC